MASWNHGIISCINFITLLSGLILLGTWVFLATHDHMTCLSLLSMPCLKIGTILVAISLLGLLGSCWRSSFLMWVYLLIYLILIMVMIIDVVLWIIVMAKGDVRLDVGQAHKINDFTYWFQDQVMGMADWSQVRQCLIRKNICPCHGRKYNFFFSHNLKQGCCHPPPVCSVNFSTKHDCRAWKNQTDTMCYYCSTCAEGFVSQLAVLWQRLFPGMVVLLFILIIVFTLGCRVFRQNKADHYKRLYQTAKP